MSFLRPMMRTRILNASRPLSRQVLASSTMPVLSLLPRQLRLASSSATPVSKPVAKRIVHNPALHCATCPFTAHERVYLKSPLTGGPFLPDDKLVKAIEKYYLTRAATAPTDYSGADSEKNYNARTQSLEAARRERADLIKKLLIKQLAAKHEVSEREAKRVVRSLVRDVESVRERMQRRERREKGRREKGRQETGRQEKGRQEKEQRKQRLPEGASWEGSRFDRLTCYFIGALLGQGIFNWFRDNYLDPYERRDGSRS